MAGQRAPSDRLRSPTLAALSRGRMRGILTSRDRRRDREQIRGRKLLVQGQEGFLDAASGSMQLGARVLGWGGNEAVQHHGALR
jgi:hypothetical protein